jgi:N-acetylglucosaminyldiphosphoundecaprenol N-acetyl-beta-D-mannosaminyltransferase
MIHYSPVSKKINICNVFIDSLTFYEALKKIELSLQKRSPNFIVTPNVDHIMTLQHDRLFAEIYSNAYLTLADGMPLIWASKFLGTPLTEKVSGSDLFPRLCELSANKGYKLFFLGGRPGAALRAREVLEEKYPQIKIVGVHSPPYDFENDKNENDTIVRMIKGARPDILFVGLGAPKQEKWIYKYYKEINVSLNIGIGVGFEFVAGMVKRAPLWMQNSGFEWFWRLLMEPKRLWKRYLVDDMKFFWLVLKQKMQK